ncbi:MAG: metal-dependent hydrolase [Gemmatimonadales bacterium]
MPGVGGTRGKRSGRNGREARIDPVCHTLVGAALSRSGLGRRTALGATALIVGANLPDLDALAYFAGPAADLEWRRGWSHGVLALATLPFLLTGALLLFHRVSRFRRRWDTPSVAVPGQLVLLSFIAILSHPLLDGLNTYGIRWLMPFSDEWFYGDTLFIVDPWVLLALSLGLYFSARREKAKRAGAARPVWLALGLVTLYVQAMALSGREARRIVAREVGASSGAAIHDVMAGPVPLDPTVRSFVIEQEEHYRVGTFRWLDRPHIDHGQVLTYPRGRPSHPAFTLAEESPLGRRFLGWARYPTFDIQQVASRRFLVHIVDLRYARERGENFGSVSIPVTLPTASSPSRDNLEPSLPAAPASVDP